MERGLVVGDLLDSFPQKSDGGDESPLSPISPSRYSSCSESDFDRYCSANSLMGTPSICSSIAPYKDCSESEFGSLRSFGGVDDGSLDNFSLGGQFTGNLDGQKLLNPGVDNSRQSDKGLMICDGVVVEEDDVASSKYLHSEDEDSMYKYGSDDENKSQLYFPGKNQLNEELVSKLENENPFRMNTSVAFGSGDWNDFELELEGNHLNTMRTPNQENELFETQRIIFQSPVSVSLVATPCTEGGISSTNLPGTGAFVHGNERLEAKFVNDCVSGRSFLNEGEIELSDNEFAEETEGSDTTSSVQLAKTNQSSIGVSVTSNHVLTTGQRSSNSQNMCDSVDLEITKEPLTKRVKETGLNTVDCGIEYRSVNDKKVFIVKDRTIEKQVSGNAEEKLDALLITKVNELCFDPSKLAESTSTKCFEDPISNSPPLPFENMTRKLTNNLAVPDVSHEKSAPNQMESRDLNEFYCEIVDEMAEILLDNAERPGAGFSHRDSAFKSHAVLPLRDGGSTASTSSADYDDQLLPHILRIDGIEVIGARQKKGDVSLGERLVGVKQYTVYRIRVWSGKDQWEIERRYRDFFTLYRRLKTLYSDEGHILPSPWSSLEKESRKIFGNVSPDAISERSALLQDCLQSLLRSRILSTPPTSLTWFLSPQNSFPSSSSSKRSVSQFTSYTHGGNTESVSTFGATISLVVETRPYKPMKQMLESQHYTCAGCRKHFDDGKTLMTDFVQTLGWGKPRLCDYTGQLFCSSCHANETAVLPARVLHFWDFTPYQVSQMAKSYLDSIHDQPMLCVSAVNPLLFSKVPVLNQVMAVRKKTGAMLSYVRCPFRMSINKGLGSRRYLIETNDFFALRDLIDLSKGVFSALPVFLETVSRKILEHITEQCLVCCDVGVPCSARQFCDDPSSLIFPFQETEVQRCVSCESAFHKACFMKLSSCFCGAPLNNGIQKRPSKGISKESSEEVGSVLSLFGNSSRGSSAGLFSRIFSMTKSEKTINEQNKNNDTVILMGSLPSTSL